MDSVRTQSRLTGTGIMALLLLLLACLVLNAVMFWLLKSFAARLAVQDQGGETLNRLAQWAGELQHAFWLFFVPSSFLFFGLLGLSVLFLIRRAGSRSSPGAGRARTPTPAKPSTGQLSAEKADLEQRLFLHLVTVLQREGRMVDFLFENLGDYSDTQIGTAVRSIHENCRKVIDKYLAPHPVVRENEGETITVEQGFDPSAVKLTGNVTGEPPFRGTVRHRGWKVRHLELPTLSGRPDPSIIAPAEVEVL